MNVSSISGGNARSNTGKHLRLGFAGGQAGAGQCQGPLRGEPRQIQPDPFPDRSRLETPVVPIAPVNWRPALILLRRCAGNAAFFCVAHLLRFVLDRTLRNRYDSAVRRAPAILLLGIFGFSLIVPVLAVDSASKLPACCRRDGEHRCAMTGTRSEAAALIQAVCPAYPKTGATPAYSKTAVAGLCQVVAGPTASESTYRAQTAVLAHSSFSRTRQKRGPPKRIS